MFVCALVFMNYDICITRIASHYQCESDQFIVALFLRIFLNTLSPSSPDHCSKLCHVA